MTEEIHCNGPQCRRLLDSFAWVTFCSHIFCEQHGLTHFSQLPSSCPVCGVMIPSKGDVIRIDLDPPEQFKNMILAGLKPDIVLDVCGRAFNFWNYQMEKERHYQQHKAEQLKSQMMELETYYEGVLRNTTLEMSSLKRQMEQLQRDRDNIAEQKESVVAKLSEKSRQNQKLKTMYDTIRRRNNNNIQLPLQSSMTSVVPYTQLGSYCYTGDPIRPLRPPPHNIIHNDMMGQPQPSCSMSRPMTQPEPILNRNLIQQHQSFRPTNPPNVPLQDSSEFKFVPKTGGEN